MDFYARVVNKIVQCRNRLYQYKESCIWENGYDQFSHVTYCAVGNTGDTMLSQCVRKIFTQKFGKKRWNIVSVTANVNEMTISHLNMSNLLIIGGGGLFIDDTNHNDISGWQWPISKQYLNELRVPIVVFSVGYNYFRGQSASNLFIDNLTALVRKAEFVGLRNSGSVRAVQELLPDNLKGKILYQPCVTTLISRIYDVKHRPYGKTIAFNVAFDRVDKRFGEKKETVLSQIAMAAKELERRGYIIIYVAHMKEDLDFLPYLVEAEVDYKVKNISNYLPSQTINFYKNIDIVIGMRGHAQMIPFGMNCGIVTLGSHDKMRWFLEDIGCMDLYVELNADENSICDRITQCVVSHYSGTKFDLTLGRLRECQDNLLEISKRNLNMIGEVVKAGEDRK